MADNVFILLAGIGLIALSFLNVRYGLARRGVKRLGWLGSLPDTKVAGIFYGGVASFFAFLIGVIWISYALAPLLHFSAR